MTQQGCWQPHTPPGRIMRSTASLVNPQRDLFTELGRTKVPQSFDLQGSHPPPLNSSAKLLRQLLRQLLVLTTASRNYELLQQER